MELPFEHGFDVIAKMLARRAEDKREEMLFNIFCFAQPNVFNQKYEGFGDFKKSLSAVKPDNCADTKKIFENVKNILDSYAGGE